MVAVRVHLIDAATTGHIDLPAYYNIAIDNSFGEGVANFDVSSGDESVELAHAFIRAASELLSTNMTHTSDALSHLAEHIEHELQREK